MAVAVKLLPPAVVAHALGQMLGVGRQWIDFLNDCRQGRTPGAFGVKLLPFGCTAGDPDSKGQVLYHPASISAFVASVRERSGMVRPYGVELQAFTCDPASARLPDEMWRLRRLSTVGS